jgi:hypothetical protein
MIASLLGTREKEIDLDPAGQIFCTEGNCLNARSPNPHTDNIKNFTVGGTKQSHFQGH